MRIVTTTKERRVYLGIRIPPGLKKRLEEEARTAGKSVTAAVEAMIVWALARTERARSAK